MPSSKQILVEYPKSKGFTLLELLVVVTILGILASLAIPSFSSLIKQQKIKNVSYDMVSTLIRARSEAMNRGINVVISPIDGTSWLSGWTVVAGGGILSQYAAFTGLSVVCKSGTTVVTTCPAITYNSFGRVTGTTSPAIQVRDASSSYVRCINIDLSGRPNSTKVVCP